MEKKEQSPLTPTFKLDDFFTTQEQRDEEKKDKVEEIELSLIDDFPNHPFHVVENDELKKLQESIRVQGVLDPILVRPKENGRYEIVSGHRRRKASELIGLEKIKCIIKDYTDDEAIINMVDSNLHRERILPSEKAFAYKMKLEAMKHQGIKRDSTSAPVVPKLEARDYLADEVGESREQIRRYIRLTYLVPELLQMVDNAELGESPAIAFRPAVELSYLKEEEQKSLVDSIGYNDATPSLEQSLRLKKLSQTNKLDVDAIDDILSEEKANQIPRLRIREDVIRKAIPKNIRVDNMEEFVMKAVEYYSNHLRQIDRGAR
ncbi:MAG: ParB/RepB/Spo0J family partition protein [Bacilli bacterium]|nr:ParB/RepB/Spo0J family partition protein [Bacilli bacterium]